MPLCTTWMQPPIVLITSRSCRFGRKQIHFSYSKVYRVSTLPSKILHLRGTYGTILVGDEL
ncbi:hypothetical protein BABINDRAFT_106298 [Babjeviella inositovora NRRL Y-12698]|uniref:Uncharacterized protein n=1 Tax=Babjeviella inositovora NRRL Y-12698 TaxID=984486 RepID=A0A1E3QJ49_9ASCO|nr:uncharacterized protein BABINDRAFT_106298 [Babjeviella inositovora NRRL Y-12698]ODQ77007.1 hypothetical protein BABINDRAFT_106298 [Babjeviella inositovora NRRL Y-12698]